MEPAIELANLAVDGTQVRLIYSHASVDQLKNTILVAYSTHAVFSAQLANISGSANSRTPLTIYLTILPQNYLDNYRQIIEATSAQSLDEDQQKDLQRTRDTVKEYSDELVNGWNQEIDSLLTFVRFSSHVNVRLSRATS